MNTRRVLLGCALAALSALLLTLAFPPFDAGWLVWVAMVPMLVAQYRVLPPAWSALAPALGIGGFLWGYLGGMFPERAAWYMKALPILVGAIYFALSHGGRARQDRIGYRWWPLLAATSWVAVEFVRLPLLGMWAFWGGALYRYAWLLQPVRVFGIFGLDLLIVLANYALAAAMMANLDRMTPPPVRVVPRDAALWCGGVLVALGAWCASGLAVRDAGQPLVRIAVLQPGVRPRGDTPDARDRAILDRLTAQTRIAASRGARLVVWPEAALARDPAVDYQDELANLARTSGARVVVGYGIATPQGRRNESVTVDPSGVFAGRYGKDHAVGFFGESSIWRGTYPTVDTPFGRMGTIICYDMDFTDSARRLALKGAQIIAVPSADWPQIASKHYTFAVFRALETGAAFAKSEYSRDSAIVDGYGRIHASAVTPRGSEAILVADVPLRDGVPLAARLGDWVGWLCLFGLVGQYIGRQRWRRNSKATPPFTTTAPHNRPG